MLESKIKESWKTNNFEREEQFQSAAFMLLSQEFPQLRDKIWHTKNESSWFKLEGETEQAFKKRCMIWGNHNKALGMLAGVMDLLCYDSGILYKNELKLPKGNINDAQEKIHRIWNREHPENPIWISRTLEDVYNWGYFIVSKPFKIIKNS